ncbi:hypothetical protein IFR05_012757 [Cadophora sp. M221]|nr:hypothetical protein IFR05_012757 [Cadophora sp. M221]
MSDNDGFSIAHSKATTKGIKNHQRRRPLLFLDLPHKIRDLIYHHCFLPKKRFSPQDWEKYSVYKCQWNGRRQFIPIAKDKYDKKTPVDGAVEDIQRAEGIYTKIQHHANKRHGSVIEIKNTQKQTISGLIGIGLLGTNQQVYNEASKLLYRNTFVINTAVSHCRNNLNINLHLYPGFPNKNGTRTTGRDNTRRIHKFLSKEKQPSFSKYDPLLMFLRTIGPHCASLIRSITSNGEFKTVTDDGEIHPRYRDKLPFADILNIYTYILNELCPDLKTLTLDRIWDIWRVYDSPADESEGAEWTWALEDEREDEERISEIAEKIAKELPNLKSLQVGECSVPLIRPRENSGDGVKDPWGVAVKWFGFVKDRERVRVLEEMRRIRAGERVEQGVTGDRVFKLKPVQTKSEAKQEELLRSS